MGLEKSGESQLLSVIRSYGFKAWHMDCTVDGFPDILAMGNGRAFTVEVKYGEMSKPLVKAFEPTQPVWHHGVNSAGFHNTFQVLYDGHKKFHLFCERRLYEHILATSFHTFKDLFEITSGNSHDIVNGIMLYLEGKENKDERNKDTMGPRQD
jgi:hypothetical protein